MANNNYITSKIAEEHESYLVISPDELSAILGLDVDYDKQYLANLIKHATEVVEVQNSYAIIPKKVNVEHNNCTILLPVRPLNKILSVKKLYGNNLKNCLELDHQKDYELQAVGNFPRIHILPKCMTNAERITMGFAPPSSGPKKYHKDSKMLFAVEYHAGKDYENLVPDEQYKIISDIPPVLKNRIIKLAESIYHRNHSQASCNNSNMLKSDFKEDFLASRL